MNDSTTKIDLRATYRWPVDEETAEPIRWSGLDLSDVLDGPLPGLCAYYGHGMSEAIGADYQLTKKKGAFGRSTMTHHIATIEIEAQISNPVPGSRSSIERWTLIDGVPPVLDVRASRYPPKLRPTLEALFGTKKFREVLRTEPHRARELLDVMPHIEAVVFSVSCKDDVPRTLMWVVDPERTITSISSKSGLTFELVAPPAPKGAAVKARAPARKSRRAAQ